MLSLPIAVKVSIKKPESNNKAGNPDIFWNLLLFRVAITD